MNHFIETVGLFIIIAAGNPVADAGTTVSVTRAGSFRSMADCARASKQAWVSDRGGLQFKFVCVPISSAISMSDKVR